jgi:peptide/nickel transport system permease protein
MLVMALTAIFAPLLAPYDPSSTFSGQGQVGPFNSRFLLGTDWLGRDILSRIIFGARLSLIVGLSTVALGIAVGTVIGIVSAYAGGTFDLVVQRLIDSISAFPALILAMVLVSIISRGAFAVILALAIVNIPLTARTVRSAALGIKEHEYTLAAQAIGASGVRVVFVHILPNAMAPIIVLASVTLGWAIVVEASLSFLGVGVPPNIPSLGGMLTGKALRFFVSSPHMAIFPGVALSLTVFGINLLGDALRDVLDPRLRGTGAGTT